MVAAAYTTNLVDITLAATTTGFTAIGGGGAITAETDFSIQDTTCLSKATSATWDSAATPRGGVLFNNGAGITIPTDGAVLTWLYWWGPGVLATKALGGAEINIGSSTTAYKSWYVTGSDDWQFGGWRSYPINPLSATDRANTGSPTATLQYFGWQAYVAATNSIGKGNPYGIDAIRYGRCDLISTNGDLANGYATFLSAADWDNASTRRLGLLIPRDGAYYMQGLFQLGAAATPVDFRDSNRSIFIANTEKVTANFNTIEVRHASSRVDWTSISITALGTVSRGRFLMTDNADVNKESCTFTGMGTFNYLSNASIVTTTYRRCNQVTPAGAAFANCTFEASNDATGAIVISTPTDIASMSYCNFNNNTKAIKITASGTYSFNGHQFNGNAAQVDFTGTGTCTINPTNGSNVSQANCTASGGGTIVVNAVQLSFSFNVNPAITGYEWRIYKVTALGSLAGSVEIAGQESAISATQNNAYSYTYTANQPIAVQIIAAGYEESVTYHTLTNASSSATINLSSEGNL